LELRLKVDNQEAKVLTDQIHNLDKTRLGAKIGELTTEQMTEVMKKLSNLIVFSPKKLKTKF